MLLRRLGADADGLLSAAGIDPQVLARDNRWLDLATVGRLAEASVRITGRPWLGLELGASIDLTSHGALGLAVISSADVPSAVRTIARFAPARGAMLNWRLEETTEGSRLMISEATPLGEARPFIIDAVFATLMRALHAVAGGTEGLRVALPLAKPAWHARYQAVADATMSFDAPALVLHLPETLLARPGLAADSHAHQAACRECESALAARLDERLAAAIGRRLQAVSDGRYPSLDDLASEYGVSVRTLIRRLKQEGTSYQQLLDAARQELALWCLQHTDRTAEDIAQRLGYEDVSNFSRTCRRWFGCAPTKLREQARSPPMLGRT